MWAITWPPTMVGNVGKAMNRAGNIARFWSGSVAGDWRLRRWRNRLARCSQQRHSQCFPAAVSISWQNGQRNNFRGDGYFEQDGSLTKILKTHEGQALRISWEVFNVSNTSHFDTS